MNKLTIALLGSIALFGLRGVAAAQTGVTRIAYDQCRADLKTARARIASSAKGRLRQSDEIGSSLCSSQ